MKSNKKKFAAALAMLLVSVLTLSTATFAWFSMNTSVTAQGMSVTAKSDTVFLQIKGNADEAYSGVGKAALTGAVLPVSHATKTIGAVNYGKAFEALTDITTVANWWYGYSASADVSTLNESTASKFDGDAIFESLITSTSKTGYFLKTVYDVNINSNSGLTTASDLVISEVTIAATEGTEGAIADGVTVIIAGVDGYAEYNASSTTASGVIANSIPKDAESTKVTVYIYIDGENANVKTVNAEKLAGSISFKLACTASEPTT